MGTLEIFTRYFVKNHFYFWHNSPHKRGISYKGKVFTKRWGDIEIEFYFPDKTLTSFPKAYVLDHDHSELQPYHFPHLDGKWQLCFDDGVKIFDKYQTQSMVQYCIGKVLYVLNNMQTNDMKEIIPEFRAYWESDSFPFYGNIALSSKYVYFNSDKVSGYNENIDVEKPKNVILVPIFRITHVPSFKGVPWPIEELSSIKLWLHEYPHIYPSIVRYIKSNIREYRKKIRIILYSERENIFFGITVEIKSPLVQKKFSLQNKTIDNIYNSKAYIENRFWVDNYSVKELITSNNNPEESGVKDVSLSDKKILLIGAGTIGSHIASLLVRNGAGAGIGSLSIIDYDVYEPCNFSRHFLGIDSTGKFKAKELKNELSRLAPFCNIISYPKSIYTLPIIPKSFDIVIDSTGEESLTMWLNELLYKSSPLFISAWVRGKGEAVEAFVMNNTVDACHECFRRSDKAIKYYGDDLPIRDSCGSVFVPFPITASLYSSLLAIDVLNKWLTGELGDDNFFSQKISPVQKIETFKIDKDEECPVCGINSMME